MKQLIVTSMILVMILSLGVAFAGPKGNGLPSGKHYNLNLIAAKEKNVEPDEGVSHGHRIFVKSDGKTKILLRQTPEDAPDNEQFMVLDYDGTDGEAKFQLPHPDPDETADDQWTTSAYSVYIRVRGKPGGSIQMTTVGIDEYGNEYASIYSVVETRTTGKGSNKFTNVSKELLYIYAWVYNWDTLQWEFVRLPLFDDALAEYLWDVDTNDLFKIAQLRFYPIPSDIPPIPTDPGPPPAEPPANQPPE
jgi:hypothetical protein